MACIDEMGHAAIQAKEDHPMDETTHILIGLPSKQQEDLYRADGMLVASRQSDIVRFGHDISTAQSRLFLNADHAKAFLRRLAVVDLYAEAHRTPLSEQVYGYNAEATLKHKAVIEERDGESLILGVGSTATKRLH
jgi:hypothetical protein